MTRKRLETRNVDGKKQSQNSLRYFSFFFRFFFFSIPSKKETKYFVFIGKTTGLPIGWFVKHLCSLFSFSSATSPSFVVSFSTSSPAAITFSMSGEGFVSSQDSPEEIERSRDLDTILQSFNLLETEDEKEKRLQALEKLESILQEWALLVCEQEVCR